MDSLQNDYNFTRLARPGEKTWLDIVNRFIDALIARGCKTNHDDLRWVFQNFYALPNSPALLTAGDPKGFYASACSSYPVHDTFFGDMFGIRNIQNVSEDATLAGIGVGYNVSQLRGRLETVRGRKGISGGPVSFLRKFSGNLSEITQATRKSACMGNISVHHPDIMDVITAKSDPAKLSNFNLTLLATDNFMNAVVSKEKYQMRPIKSEPFEMDADTVFHAACENGWKHGEPAWAFVDTIIRDYFNPELLNVNNLLQNPCQPGFATVLTPEGIRTFADIDVGSTIWSGQRWTKVIAKVATGIKEVFEYDTPAGSFIGTEEHRVISCGERIQVQHAVSIDPCCDSDGRIVSSDGTIVSIRSMGEHPVYDITVDAPEHTYWTGGLLVSNCNEALLSYGERFFSQKLQKEVQWLELCCLASINLPLYVKLCESDRRRVVQTVVSVLNDIIDLQDYTSELHRVGMQEVNRKIGVGFAGLATVLATSRVRYSSEEARAISSQWSAEINRFALDASESLVSVFGEVQGLGRCNASLMSMAPTSTLANVFNHVNPEGCSYGLEPYFSVGEHMVKNSYGEFIKKDKIVEALNGDTAHIETANQLSWRGHVGVLEAVAKAWLPGTGMCISKTINFKENISLDEYKEAVLYCWRAGLKSVSFYRDGSRKDQVINVGKTDEAGKSKRPTSVPCDIYHTTCEGQKWLVCVGMNEGQPYEVFAGLQSTVLLPKTYTKGRIVKGKGKKYNLHVGEGDNELVIQDLPTAFANPVHASQTRVLSFCLRHKAPLNFLVDQLQKDGDMNSFSKVISRILKKYVAESAKSGHKCECGAHMQYVSGCLSCPACGKSLCG